MLMALKSSNFHFWQYTFLLEVSEHRCECNCFLFTSIVLFSYIYIYSPYSFNTKQLLVISVMYTVYATKFRFEVT